MFIEKKIVSAIMLTLLLTSMLTLAFNIQPAKASETIIDTHGDSRFTKYPSGPYWWSVADHDAFHTRAYNNNFWYTYCGDAAHGGDLYWGKWDPPYGQYEVSVWIPNPDPFGTYTPTHSANYDIYHSGGFTEIAVNQALRLGGWYSLGSYTFVSGSMINLDDRTGEPYTSTMVAFDAIKFTQVVPPRTLTVSSAHDSPNPSNGQHTYNDGSWVTCSVTSPADQSGGTRYRCTGYTGTGSCPSGTGTSVTFAITQDSTIVWNWAAQYSLTVASAHDSPSPSVGTWWYDSGASLTCSVTSPAEGYSCTGWTGTGSVPSSGSATSTSPFIINQGSAITWNWIVTPPVPRTLTVSSAHDSPNPSNGQHTYNDGSSVTCSVSSPVTEGSTVWTCTGWTATGSVPPSGTGTSTGYFYITQDSSITWNWQGSGVQRTLTVNSAHDSPVPGTGPHTYNNGDPVTCSVTSPVTEGSTVWTCTGWSGTGSVPASGTGKTVTFTITQDSSITWNWIVTPTTEWTFATITDLHIGRGYDYNGEIGRDFPEYNNEDYYLTQRLQQVVDWIKTDESIRFVVVLGDITEHGRTCEMEKAKGILDTLGAIPYFLVIGNHDIKAEGDSVFDEVFDDNFFMTQCGKLGVEWINGRIHVPWRFQNYAFVYNNKRFVFLDYVDRGVDIGTPNLNVPTEDFLQTQLQYGDSTFLFSHHPMISAYSIGCFLDDDIQAIEDTIRGTTANVLGNFAGHLHGYFDPAKRFDPYDTHPWPLGANPQYWLSNVEYAGEYNTPAGISVIGTEALMVASNELLLPSMSKGIIRIVRLAGDTFSTSEEGEFSSPSMNPYFAKVDREDPPWGKVTYEFTVYAFNKWFTAENPGTYILDYGDGTQPASLTSTRWDDEPKVFKHDYEGGRSYYVVLRVTGSTAEGQQGDESIKIKIEVPRPWNAFRVKCPVDMIITDPDGHRISKLINEIPGATYTEADLDEDGEIDKLVLIPTLIDGDYTVTLNGTDTGVYHMIAEFVTAGGIVNFTATEIPVSLGATHNFTISWAALSQGGQGVAVEVDSDGNGVPEYTFASDSELTRTEYVVATTKYDIGITEITSTKSVVGQGYNLPINTTIINYGAYTETFNVTIYANTILAASQTVTLASGNFTTIVFTWNTADFAKGKYTIKAVADTLTGETYTIDNTLTAGTITITIPGDVDGNFEVDIFDVTAICVCYDSKLGPPRDPLYYPNCDLDGNGIIDIYDVTAACITYGQKYP